MPRCVDDCNCHRIVTSPLFTAATVHLSARGCGRRTLRAVNWASNKRVLLGVCGTRAAVNPHLSAVHPPGPRSACRAALPPTDRWRSRGSTTRARRAPRPSHGCRAAAPPSSPATAVRPRARMARQARTGRQGPQGRGLQTRPPTPSTCSSR